MNTNDQDALRALLTDGRRIDRLVARVTESLGRPPRRLPSRTSLAIEALAPRLMVTAAVITGIALGASLLARGASQAREGTTRIVSGAIEGKAVRADEVFAAMTGLGRDGGEQP